MNSDVTHYRRNPAELCCLHTFGKFLRRCFDPRKASPSTQLNQAMPRDASRYGIEIRTQQQKRARALNWAVIVITT